MFGDEKEQEITEQGWVTQKFIPSSRRARRQNLQLQMADFLADSPFRRAQTVFQSDPWFIANRLRRPEDAWKTSGAIERWDLNSWKFIKS